jgi:hypothetical protein
MKSTQWKRLFKRYLEPHIPGYQIHGSLIVEAPPGYLLRGYSIDSSAFSKEAFYLHVFVQPLYEPMDHIHYLFGERILSAECHPDDEANDMKQVLQSIMRDGMPFLQQLRSPADIAKRARTATYASNPYAIEIVAYSEILDGNDKLASRLLKDAHGSLKVCMVENPLSSWIQTVADRVSLIDQLFSDSPDRARLQLEEWRLQTLKNLKLIT